MKFRLAVMIAVSGLSVSCSAEEPAKPEAAQPAAVAPGKPKIQFDQTTYDFGKTSNVASVTGTFTFHNAGDAELQLRKPAPACGCTVASVKPEVLKPGEKGELVFTLNTGNVRGVAQKTITVPSNDPATPNVQLTIRVDVAQVFEINPQFVAVGDIRQGVITNGTIRIKRLDGKPLVISRIGTSKPHIRARFEPVADSNGMAVDVIVTVEGEGNPRRFSEQVQIFIEDQASPIGMVAVHGRLVGDVSVSPERLVFPINNMERLPASRQEALLMKTVRIMASKPEEKLELRDAESTLKNMQLELVTREAGKEYLVIAKLIEMPKQSEQGTITVHTNLASQPLVQVPFAINVIQR